MKQEENPFTKEAQSMIEEQAKDNAQKAQEQATAEANTEATATLEALPPIICLGEEGRENVYWSRVNNNIYRLTPTQHTPNDLRRMAKVEHYAKWLHPEYDREQIRHNKRLILVEAGERLLEDTAGAQFNADCERGRGVWKSEKEGEFMLNTGNGCYLLDPQSPALTEASNVHGKHLYTNSKRNMPPPHTVALSYAEGKQVIDFLEARSWMVEGSGRLLAGWCVCSILSAALPIRPQMWINAPSNTGKSFLYADLSKILKGVAIKMDGAETTEPALRGDIQKDACPILWDEIEQDAGDMKKGQNIKRIIALIRNATSGGTIKKGASGGGEVRSYKALCCFLLFSISHSLENDSDANRFFQLRLRKASDEAITDLLQRQQASRAVIEQADFTAKLITRAMQELPSILSNAKSLETMFRKQGLPSRRAALFAVVLAAAHALEAGGIMSEQEQKASYDLTQQYKANEEEREADSMRCLHTILNIPTTFGGAQRSIRSLLDETHGYTQYRKTDDGYNCMKEDIYKVLESFGFSWKFHDAEQHARLFTHQFNAKQRLRGTPWEHGNLVPIIMEGETKVNSKNKFGVIYKKLKSEGRSMPCFLIPPYLIITDKDE